MLFRQANDSNCNLFTAEQQLPFKSFTNFHFSRSFNWLGKIFTIFFIFLCLFLPFLPNVCTINVITHDIVVKYELLKFIKNESIAESTKEFNWTTLLPSRNEKTFFYALCAFSERNAKYFLLPLFYLSIFNEIFFSLSIESLKIIIYQAKKKQEEPNWNELLMLEKFLKCQFDV